MAAAKRRVYGIVGHRHDRRPQRDTGAGRRCGEPRLCGSGPAEPAEHDRLATAVLVCDSEALAGRFGGAGAADSLLPRADIARASIDNNGKIIIARDMAEGVDIANEIAPEHLRSAWTTRSAF